jgi:branched-chain amino acid transport system ATP-binding protein
MAECLSFANVSAGYGETVVLDGISLSMATGETVALLGRNGVGKTTLLATALGHTTLHSGAISFDGKPIERLKVFQRARLGIGYVPQEREIFPSLDVDENLTIAARGSHSKRTASRSA